MKHFVNQAIDLMAILLCLFLAWAFLYLSYTQSVSKIQLGSLYLTTLILSYRCERAYEIYKQDKNALKFFYIIVPRVILVCVAVWVTVKELFF